VPGITSALAAAASAQIFLTDRRFADRVVLLTAHTHRANDAAPAHGSAVADSRTTCVVYMPGAYGKVADMLISTGISPDAACLVISKISSPGESRHLTSLKQLAELTPLSPSLLIVGNVVDAGTAVENGCTRVLRQKKEDFVVTSGTRQCDNRDLAPGRTKEPIMAVRRRVSPRTSTRSIAARLLWERQAHAPQVWQARPEIQYQYFPSRSMTKIWESENGSIVTCAREEDLWV